MAGLAEEMGRPSNTELALLRMRLDSDSNFEVSIHEFARFTRGLGFRTSFRQLLHLTEQSAGKQLRMQYADTDSVEFLVLTVGRKLHVDSESSKEATRLLKKHWFRKVGDLRCLTSQDWT